MKSYNKVLVGVDLSEESGKIIAKALHLAGGNSDRLQIIYVMEALSTAYPFDAYPIDTVDLQQSAVKGAGDRLSNIANELAITDASLIVEIGAPGPEIRKAAVAANADLIVVGSHGTAGWRLLLGSTANSVLHGAPCDVLTVRVGEKS